MNDSNQAGSMPASVKTASTPELATVSHQRRGDDLLRRQQAVVALGRRAIVPPELPILMQDAAALLAEILRTESSGVAELSSDGKSLRLRLVLGETDTSDARTLVQTTSVAATDSLAGYALQVAHPVVVDSFAQESRFVDMFLREHGIQSAVAVPLQLDERSFGLLAAYSIRGHHFDQQDILFVEAIAHLVTTTIARRQAETSLADQRRLTATVLQTVDALVLVLNPQWEIVSINPAAERITGFSLKEIQGRSLWKVFSAGDETGEPRPAVDNLQERTSPVGHESYLLTKHSERRLIAWSFSALAGSDGTLESIIATGTDITAGHEAEAFSRLPIPENVERRKYPRRSYPYCQTIALVVDGKLPEKDEFREVQCNDIGAGGFSYMSATPPSCDTLVVALGIPPKITYLTAQVAHITRVEQDGRPLFRVGCNYMSRAEY